MSGVVRFSQLLQPLKRTSVPHRHIFLDTEAQTRPVNGEYEQTWMLGVADYCRITRTGEVSEPDVRRYRDPASLWADVAAFHRSRERVIIWCHNLAYDLRLSKALVELPLLDYQLVGIVLERTAAWASFRHQRGALTFCDLHSWLPTSLEKIGLDVGIRQPGRPKPGASLEEQFARCESDVAITRAAVLGILDWLKTNDLGPFRPTGAGQSHAAFRRRFLTHRMLAHDDQRVLAMERQACWTGRAEAWKHGKLAEGPYTEYDLNLAYCRIAAECDVPSWWVGAVSRPSLAAYERVAGRFAVLARARIQTNIPCVPAGLDDKTVWPVGDFETVLWDSELSLAIAAGANVQVLDAQLYRKAPALQAFAQWCIDGQATGGHGETPLQRRLLKHWSRTLVGRMGLRYRSWEPFGEAPTSDLQLGLFRDAQSGHQSDMLQVGRDLFTLTELTESRTSLPQVTGWIMAEARRRLWELATIAGRHHVVYMDTDSLIVDRAGARNLNTAIKEGQAYSLKRKARYQELIIRGPRIIQLDGEHRIAGIPLSATNLGEGHFTGELWRGLRESIARGQGDRVTTMLRAFNVAEIDNRRTHLRYGETAPFRIIAGE